MPTIGSRELMRGPKREEGIHNPRAMLLGKQADVLWSSHRDVQREPLVRIFVTATRE